MIKSGSSQPLGNFEELLLAELSAVVAQHAADLGTDPVPGGAGPAPAPRRARRLLVPATLAAAVIAAAAFGVIHTGARTGAAYAAYAVDKQPDGSVLITVRDASRLAGLPARLADVGLPAQVVPITASCPPVRLNPIPESLTLDIDDPAVLDAKPGTTVHVRVRGTVPAGQVLVIGVANPGVGPVSGGWTIRLVTGFTAHPPTCLPVPKLGWSR